MEKVRYYNLIVCRFILNENNNTPSLINNLLGQSVDQKGSLVDSEKLRFDFSWSGALTVPQFTAVENIVVDQIRKGLTVHTEVVALSAASSINSLRCVFGEKYPDPVRVVSVGAPISELLQNPSNSEWGGYSIEFCGGTHLTNTSEAEDFVLVEESGIAKGIRRIVGLTKGAAAAARSRAAGLLYRLADIERMDPSSEKAALSKSIKVEVRSTGIVMKNIRMFPC